MSLTGAGSSAFQARRLRSTRLLWDPTYTDEGWIAQPVYLIPRMQQWIGANYPDTGTAITEYNWGALDHINGALAQADVLGIFGREGLTLATLWAPPEGTDPGAFAFRMFRNYDSTGASFGESSIAASSADESEFAVFASERISDGALTAIAINKTDRDLICDVTISGFDAAVVGTSYLYSEDTLTSIAGGPSFVPFGGFEYPFPAFSIAVLEIPLDTSADMPGDCSGNRRRDTDDIRALSQEIFDGDGIAAVGVAGGSHVGDPAGCDPCADDLVNAGDLSCAITTLTIGPGLCG